MLPPGGEGASRNLFAAVAVAMQPNGTLLHASRRRRTAAQRRRQRIVVVVFTTDRRRIKWVGDVDDASSICVARDVLVQSWPMTAPGRCLPPRPPLVGTRTCASILCAVDSPGSRGDDPLVMTGCVGVPGALRLVRAGYPSLGGSGGKVPD
jgi:hypothetical protein